MSLQRILPWLVLALVTSVVFMIAGVGRGLPVLAGAAAAAFSLLAIGVGVGINRPLWRLDPIRITAYAAPVAAQQNAKLMALTYAWGAAAMAGVYTLGGLRWYHAWQYGAGMALLGLVALGYGLAIGRTQDLSAKRMLLGGGLQLTLAQALATTGAALYLLVSGKLMTARPDWAANQIFLFGGIAIAALSAMAAYTQRKLVVR